MSHLLIKYPCSVSNKKAGLTGEGHEIELDMITLPLTPYLGSPPCLVSYIDCISELKPGDFVYQIGHYIEYKWVVIGAGVPAMTISTNDDDGKIDLQSQKDIFKTFKDHWFFLRGDRMIPKVSEFLSRPIPRSATPCNYSLRRITGESSVQTRRNSHYRYLWNGCGWTE